MDALERLPPGPITVNHLGLRFPDVDARDWRMLMRTLATRPQSFVQLSGLPFLYGERWRDDDAARVLDDALDILGPRRLLFASDWPMLVRFATYTEWVRTVEDFVQRRELAQSDVDAIFAGNVIAANPRLDALLDDTTTRSRDASYPHSSSHRLSEKLP
jgi:L-fuconolactonase